MPDLGLFSATGLGGETHASIMGVYKEDMPGEEPDDPFGTFTGIPTQQGEGRSLLVDVESCGEPVVVELVRNTGSLDAAGLAEVGG